MSEILKKNRNVLIVSIIVLVISGYVFAQQTAFTGAQNITSNINTTRYIMFGGAYNVENTDQISNAVFKLDTYTGDTWILRVTVDQNGNSFKKWVPVSPNNAVANVNMSNPDASRIKELYNKSE